MAADSQPDSLLSAERVSIERGYRQLLTDVSFAVAPGELWQLAGANGVGKTSFLRALAGLMSLGVEGRVTVNSALLYQGHLPGLKPLLTPVENLRWHPSGDVDPDPVGIIRALELVGLAGFEETAVLSLSAGQQRRVGLARLWLSAAPLWLLDEPFTAIDVDGAALLEARIVNHVEAGGAVVFTSHQPNRFAGRLKLLDLGAYAA